VQQQNANGSWSEEISPARASPAFFYLKYHLYKNSFPVYALARYRNQASRAQEYCAVKFRPGEFRVRRGLYTARERSASEAKQCGIPSG